MHVIVSYDITNNKQCLKIYKFLKEKGLHTQKSVFECEMTNEDIKQIQKFSNSLELEENDSIALYTLCKHCSSKCIVLGQGIQVAELDWMII